MRLLKLEEKSMRCEFLAGNSFWASAIYNELLLKQVFSRGFCYVTLAEDVSSVKSLLEISKA